MAVKDELERLLKEYGGTRKAVGVSGAVTESLFTEQQPQGPLRADGRPYLGR